MNKTAQIVNILLIVVIIGSLVAGYFLFIRGGEKGGAVPENSGEPLTPDFSDSDIGGPGVHNFSAAAGGGLSLSSAEVILLLGKIRNIDLDDALFKNPVFQSLGDSTVEITPEVRGILNPFGKL